MALPKLHRPPSRKRERVASSWASLEVLESAVPIFGGDSAPLEELIDVPLGLLRVARTSAELAVAVCRKRETEHRNDLCLEAALAREASDIHEARWDVNFAYRLRKASFTVSVGPFRCFAISSSASP